MKKLILVIAAISLQAAISTASAGEPYRPNTYLNVRSGPSVDYQIVGVIPPGAGVSLGDCVGEWCHMHWRAVSGWVNSRYLD
jgi:uncharacterized protein YraI